MSNINYQWIDASQTKEVSQLAVCLTKEIIERTGVQYFDVDFELTEKLCNQYLEQNKYHVVVALDQKQVIGFSALCESYALYTEGVFGILQEFYVLPEYRNLNIGKRLLDHVKSFAKKQQWKRIELCTPPLPEFDRTVSFYQDNNFERTGGYKMKYIISYAN
ncbi:GNAT family N-acetyltransferase [Acinetobacter sichuanensis]|uniref:GNAT family N-acetyltransferase n=1 Tax=Acinetobacter sichuanensis TaxID=2136183 RepID=UPI00280C8290|nr:GNAT family N-acetyltransferase [Acinetobacter sichuanensis]MDQ9022249.1 GNAT family N-acetyltransferase [Acinetobacter sichuanensis]